MEARQCFEDFGWDFNGYTRFVFVRNPWARLVSLYEMIKKDTRRWSRCPGFEQWLSQVKPYGPGGGGKDWKRWQKYGTYSLDHFAGDADGCLLVDKVIRLEDIDEELLPFLKALKLPDVDEKLVPHTNKSRGGNHYVEYYTDETVQRVRDMYEYDISQFGYEFGD